MQQKTRYESGCPADVAGRVVVTATPVPLFNCSNINCIWLLYAAPPLKAMPCMGLKVIPTPDPQGGGVNGLYSPLYRNRAIIN